MTLTPNRQPRANAKPKRRSRARKPPKEGGLTRWERARRLARLALLGSLLGGAGLLATHREAVQEAWRWENMSGVVDRLRDRWQAPQMPLAHLDVESGPRVDPDWVRSEVHRRGSDLLRLDVAALGRALEANPWVKSATIQRIFPDRLTVRIHEKTPVALIRDPGLMYIDAEGNPIAPALADTLLRYPVIQALSDAAPEASTSPQKPIREALALLESLDRGGVVAPEAVSEVAVGRWAFHLITVGGLHLSVPREEITSPASPAPTLAAVLRKYEINPWKPGSVESLRLEAGGRVFVTLKRSPEKDPTVPNPI